MSKGISLLVFLSIFVIRYDATEDVPVEFSGMSQEQITAMYEKDGINFSIVDEDSYKEALAIKAAEPKAVDPTVAIRAKAVLDAADKGKTLEERFEAHLKACGR